MNAKPPTSRRQVVLLSGLMVVLAAIVLFQVLPMLGSSGAPAPGPRASASAQQAGAAGRPAAGRRGSRGQASAGPVEQVALDKLALPWPAPTESRRNPFSMTAEPAPAPSAPPVAAAKPAEPLETVPVGPPPPPPVPPITLKFIGMVSGPGRVGKIAALSDGKFVYHGREGEIVEGRYRIIRIGEESLQIEYVNGTGRQTIRLSGK